jgi:cell wall-associated NlpC family hydrolase
MNTNSASLLRGCAASQFSSRELVCRIARSWIGTPYHHRGRVKGAGVDCAMFPLEVYREAGVIGEVEVPYYPADWMLHRGEEIYLNVVLRHAREITEAIGCRLSAIGQSASSGNCEDAERPRADSREPIALPGDFVLYHFGRCWAHGAIVLEWPLIIHALTGKGVVLADGEREGCLVGRARRWFSLFSSVCHSESPCGFCRGEESLSAPGS